MFIHRGSASPPVRAECPEISQVKNLHPCGRCANYAVPVGAPEGSRGCPACLL